MGKRRKHRLPSLLIGGLAAGLILVAAVACQRLLQPAQPTVTTAQTDHKAAFIKRLAPYAQELQRQYSVLPSITLAQAILESDWGQSTLASRYHNLFGVKGTNPATSELMATKEYVDGRWVTVKARFRVYASDEASMKDHALLLVNGTAWDVHHYDAVRQATDYQTAAKALQAAGYATDPTYAAKLISLIKTYALADYDQ